MTEWQRIAKIKGSFVFGFCPSDALFSLSVHLRGVFVVFVLDAFVSGDPDERSTRSQVGRALAQIIEPSEIDVLLVADNFDQVDPVYRALHSSEVLAARVTMTCSVDTARAALQLPTFDVVIAAGASGMEVLVEFPELSVWSATLSVVDSPTAEVTAKALTSGAMAVLAADEISTNLLQRTLQQVLLRREAQNLLINRLMSSPDAARTQSQQLTSPQLHAAQSKTAGPVQEGMTATVQ